jgi:hypothetical protein
VENLKRSNPKKKKFEYKSNQECWERNRLIYKGAGARKHCWGMGKKRLALKEEMCDVCKTSLRQKDDQRCEGCIRNKYVEVWYRQSAFGVN